MVRGRSVASEIFVANESLRADYDMAKQTRLQRRRKVPAMGSHADYHYRTESDFLKCMEYARDAMRNDVICSSMIERADTNTIQDGFLLDFQTSDESLNRTLSKLWNGWAYDADQCDVARENTFSDMESLAFTSSLVDGDICGVGTDDGVLQWYEAHRLRTPNGNLPNVIHGVELLPGRIRKSFWFTKEDLSPLTTNRGIPGAKGFNQIQARDDEGTRRVFQVYSKTVKRFSQTRGVSAFAPMFSLFGMHDDTQFNAILKQQIANALLIFKERTKDFNTSGGDSPMGPTNTQDTDDGGTEMLEGIGPGTVVKGKVGEKISTFASSVPGTDFFPHVRMILTLLGVNLGLPLVLVLMDAKETNFSGWRGAFDQAKMGFRRNQQKMIRRLHDPVLYWKVAQWAAESPALQKKLDAAYRRDGELKHIWHTPTWPYINPSDDIAADMNSVANYQDSPSGVMAKNGRDYETVGKRCISDRAMMIREAKRTAIEINSEFPEDPAPVLWHELYTPPQPKNVNMTVSENRDAQPENGGGDVTAT
jgi:capsid protein